MSHLGSLLVVYENPIYNINRFVLQERVGSTAEHQKCGILYFLRI